MADGEPEADPDAEPEPGTVTFARGEASEREDAPSDLFEQEERTPTRLVLVVMVEEDAPDLVAPPRDRRRGRPARRSHGRRRRRGLDP
jgi:hypothetical protein